jgi:RNA polymerase sigma-70 factor, ECF subfamily
VRKDCARHAGEGETVTVSSQAVPQTIDVAYRELRGALLGFLRKATGDAQLAEDLLQEVMLKAIEREAARQASPENLTGWLYAIARNAAIDHFRRARPGEPLPEDLAAPPADDEEAAVQTLAQCLRPLAERLPDTYRSTVLAAEFDGVRLADLARAEGVSISAIKSRASRGRRLMKDELLACCRVELSGSGRVLDYDTRAAQGCGPTDDIQCATGVCRK